MNNKRGQEGGLNWVLIALIIGGVVLVLYFLGGTKAFASVFDWFKTNNVNTIVLQCNQACDAAKSAAVGGGYNYCTNNKTLRADDLPEGIKEKTGTCNFFATDANYLQYGIAECSKAECPAVGAGTGEEGAGVTPSQENQPPIG